MAKKNDKKKITLVANDPIKTRIIKPVVKPAHPIVKPEKKPTPVPYKQSQVIKPVEVKRSGVRFHSGAQKYEPRVVIPKQIWEKQVEKYKQPANMAVQFLVDTNLI